MTPRAHALFLAALVLVVSPGCTEVAVGDWEMEELHLDGSELPLHFYDDYGYEHELSGELVVDPELEMEFELEWVERGYDGIDAARWTWEGEATPEGPGAYAVEMESDDDGDLDLELECTVDGDELECEGDDRSGTDYEVLFKRDD